MKLVLLHSPLTGPGTWTALAPVLREQGHSVTLPDLTPVMRGSGPFYPKLAATAAVEAGDAVLIAHSGAGALVPAIAEQCNLRGAIFLDALLPHPGKSWFETASPQLAVRLRGLAEDGELPPWHRWWPKGAMERLLPDEAQRDAFTRELATLPLAYFEERAPAATLAIPGAYLQLSDGYKAEADQAAADGWPVVRLALHHLAMLTQQDAVARAIMELAPEG